MRSSRINLLVCSVPVALVAGLFVSYLSTPQFYLTYVLEEEAREGQAVEIVTFGSAVLATLILFWSAWRIWQINRSRGAFVIALIGLATFFFAGEEINWGQTYFGGSGVRNMHNAEQPIPIQGLGSLFLVVMFFVLPIAWQFRKPKGPMPLPADWQPAIAQWPVVFCMAFAFAWKWVKQLMVAVAGKEAAEQSSFYMDFVEQFNEQKEMLVAVAILVYACYRIRVVREMRNKIEQ